MTLHTKPRKRYIPGLHDFAFNLLTEPDEPLKKEPRKMDQPTTRRSKRRARRKLFLDRLVDPNAERPVLSFLWQGALTAARTWLLGNSTSLLNLASDIFDGDEDEDEERK